MRKLVYLTILGILIPFHNLYLYPSSICICVCISKVFDTTIGMHVHYVSSLLLSPIFNRSITFFLNYCSYHMLDGFDEDG